MPADSRQPIADSHPMKLSYNWLKTYVAHDLTPNQLAHALTMAGLEVEDVETMGTSLEGVVVGEVLETRKHPNADRLTLCRVDLGGDIPVQIVCGAPNVAAGQKVPVATVGTTLLLPSRQNPSVREPVTIQQTKLRGEVSQGMICAEDELGLSDDHSGIMVLDPDAEVGAPLVTYLAERDMEASDAVLDVNITPNRPDATSHLGIARDVSALTDVLIARPEVELPPPGGKVTGEVQVEIENPVGCARYVAMVVRNVKVAESPDWLKRRLTAIGLRPRNNIVDITNFVMHECGQPLHAFDFDRVAGHKIVVRNARQGETLTTLDGKERALPEGTLLICDAERPVALAGIMGGENSEVTDETTNVLIESAYFDPSTIRRAARALGMATDASYRFERGVDPEQQVWAAARAAQLMAELAGGEIVPGVVDEHPRPIPRIRVRVRRSRVASILGVDVPPEDAKRLLTAIGFEVSTEDALEVLAEHLMEGRPTEPETIEDVYHCLVPSFRPDITREIDVIEEIARLYGYARIPEPAHSQLPNTTPAELPSSVLRNQARSLLVGLGFRELYTNSMMRRETAELFNEPILGGRIYGEAVPTLNPISQEMSALRPSLLPGLLSVMSFNRKHGQHILRMMEFGHVFRHNEKAPSVVPGYSEHEALIIGMSGPHAEISWDTPARKVDFFDIKGIVETLLQALHVPSPSIRPGDNTTPITTYYAMIYSGDAEIGVIARVSDEIATSYDLREPVYFAELDWMAVTALAAPHMKRRYAPVSRFPVVERDLALVVNRNQPAGSLLATIREAGRPLLQHVTVFDVYEGKRIDPDKKSIAFSLRFGSNKTLQDKEVDDQMNAIIRRLQSEHGAQLRG